MTSVTQDLDAQCERLLRVLSVATFIIFFQAFMVAPIIPRLALEFGRAPSVVGNVVPAYLIPYGMATLVYGLIADRFGIWRVMAASLATFAILTVLTATAGSVEAIVVWRVLTGLGASGVVPLALALIGRLYSYERRGRPLGWLFGAMAGGMAFGSTFGAIAEPLIGWRGLFVGVGVGGGITLLALLVSRHAIAHAVQPVAGGAAMLIAGYRSLLADPRGRRTYAFVLLNSIFHSGVFTWLGLYFEARYGLGPVGIGLALLGYGVPGFLLGPMIGRTVDRTGRSRLLPFGLAIGAAAAGVLTLDLPLLGAAVAVTLLSLGYDMTQPLLAGIVTSLSAQRPGQAMGLNVFMLFVGFGLGSLIFGALLTSGFEKPLGMFATVELALALAASWLFRAETARSMTPSE